jgi:hypothetical protein
MSQPPVREPDPQTAPEAHCRNCGVALHGPHCHACGQPVKGLVRPLGNLFGDVLDSVFDLDTRVFRTLPPLFAKPGFLTREYFAGRQIRYVTPFRLFFFLAVLAFFVAQVATDAPSVNLGNGNAAFAAAATVEQVERERDAQLEELAASKREMAGSPAAIGIPGIESAEQAVRDSADKRIKQLGGAQANSEPPPSSDEGLGLAFSINDKPWDPQTNPIPVGWLPGFANDWLNAQVERGNRNFGRLKQDPAAFKNAVLGAVPTVLFVLVPVFALMLKLAYVFKRRLYMEHLVIALHSHAFLCLDLLLLLLVRALAHWLAPGEGALSTLFAWAEGLLLAWMPAYLLLMQKRVYAQGWPMTVLKYFVLGTCYVVLLSFAILAAMTIGLVAM